MSQRNRQVAQTFSIREAAKLSGLGVAMVDYLGRSGVLIATGGPPKPGRGTARQFSFGDVVMLRALAALLRSGIAVSRLKRAMAELRRRHGAITPASLPGRLLVSDGKAIYFRDSAANIEDLTCGGQFVFAFVLDIAHVRAEVLGLINAA